MRNNKNRDGHRLDHVLQQLVDLVLAVAEVAALHEVVRLLRPKHRSALHVQASAILEGEEQNRPSAAGVVELEGPQEIRRLLEVRSNGDDLVYQVLETDDVVLACNHALSVGTHCHRLFNVGASLFIAVFTENRFTQHRSKTNQGAPRRSGCR